MSSCSVLVIDDEYGMRSGIQQILEMEGYEVEAASNGREALECLDRRPFDVVLVDYRLPDVDGLTLLQGIRARRSDAMTCMITAYANIETAVAATRRGIDWFLPKPFSPEDLLGVVDTLCRHGRLQQESEQLRLARDASLEALALEKSQTHSLVSCMRDAVLVVNRDGLVALANPAMAEILGVAEADLLRRRADEVLAGLAFETLRQELSSSDKNRAAFEVERGESSWLANVAVFRSDAGEQLGRIVTLSDITPVRRAATEKAKFIRMMVHELRSPLCAVRSIIEVALDRSLGENIGAYEEMLGRADKRIDALVAMIGELLSLSRIDMEPRMLPAAEIADLETIVRAVTDEHQERIAQRGLCLEVRCEAGARAAFRADDLRVVLGNLVGNAIKYNRQDGRIEVRVETEGRWLRIDVMDTGVGIRVENQGRVFDEFFREKRPEARAVEGNGLGLSIVKRLVERGGGRISAKSGECDGTTFTLMIPS